MAFWIASSPHNHNQTETSALMRLVIYALFPGIYAQWYFFGWGNIIHIALAITTALLCEFFALSLRSNSKKINKQLFDGSAILTAILIGICLPAVAPWWISVIGAAFAILVVKQLYGGLGHNPFNPAMAAYVMLLISFPVQMTSWQPPLHLMNIDLNFTNTLTTIFTGFTNEGYSVEQLRTSIDGFTMATPLDTLKTNLNLGFTTLEIIQNNLFSNTIGPSLGFAFGWEWVNIAFLIGGLILIAKKAIAWQTPISFLVSLFICSFIAYSLSPDTSASPLLHWTTGGCMLGAFFILTDPVSGATSVKGRLIMGALAGLLVYLIRTFGGYPDGIAFAVLLCNMTAPLIDQYTRPRTYGHDIDSNKG
ncbi:electron transport complex subunit RsxD [Colwellia sp. 4_MG-2023]|jgi:electron transport complex protein RnfD|uniref:electron transport complex subunit RsxD n=1 Tax=unclassified Colwellia TaxID=196834 RepID=UPI0026E36832|nr:MULTISPECIES: electron transport complex subunit RsxD [unclassified Colwellia]MDO6507380.1 electron transport complex subunit RsxD [Colwellia sp. 5_MG-2023]MDO6556113.1 electron transport complex subunit RsxD [Colwellia sp. 4_MG-2023]